MNFNYLFIFFKNHPISIKSLRNALLFFFISAFVLGLFIIHGIYAQQAVDLINENRAPKTFELICSISLIFLSAYVAIQGPIENLKFGSIRVFGVYFPNMALAIGAAYVGIAWGIFFAALLSNLKLPSHQTYGLLLNECLVLLFGLLFLYAFFVLITVNSSVAPGYEKKIFKPAMRILAGAFSLLMLGRSITVLIFIFSATKQ